MPSARAAASAAADASPSASMHQAIVHRCTFMPWNPHAINCVAYDAHTHRYVAVARSDGDVELWNCLEPRWFLEGVVTGFREHPFRCVAWSEGRLFGASLGGDIVEFDVLQLRVKHSCDSHGGAIWDLKPSPADPGLLAAACEDGHVRFFRVQDDDIQFVRGSAGTKHGERLLSLCWHVDGEVIFCGGADSQIRCFAAQSGRTLFTMTVENYGQEPTLIWSLQVLSDFTVISGDSLGHVQVWDGGIGTLRQSFAMHEADVLSVQVSSDQKHFYATGIDSKIVQFSSVEEDGEGVGMLPKRWVSTKSRRYHTHDIVSMTVVSDSNGDELVIAGGVDTQLSYLWAKDFCDVRGKVQKFLPFRQDAVCCASRAKMVALMQHQSVNIWALGRQKSRVAAELSALRDHSQLELEVGHRHMFKIQVATGGRNLECSSMSSDGQWMACSSPGVGLRLFHLKHNEIDGGSSDVEDDEDDYSDGGFSNQPTVSRISIPADVLAKDVHIHKLRFSPDATELLVVTNDCHLMVFELPSRGESDSATSSPASSPGGSSSRATLRRKGLIDARLRLSDAGGATLARSPSRINHVEWSYDGQFIAVAHSTNRVVVHPRPGSASEAVTLPAPRSPVTALAFQPTSNVLGVSHASNQITLFDVMKQELTPWSKAWRSDRIPASVRRESHALTGLTFNFLDEDTLAAATVPASDDALAPAKKKGRSSHKASAKSEGDSLASASASAPASLIAYGTEAVFFVNSAVLPGQHAAAVAAATSGGRKRKKTSNGKASNAHVEAASAAAVVSRAFKRSKKFKPTMFLQFIGPNEIVAVQVPWARISKQFVLPLHRKRYGT
eukprot:INCI14983.1.p1 GENE.INCI14983.1~~INCI14983.1.p1  ORF type:complete len:838 (+),score=159.59 INCI14983.1:250-2763(+)